MLVPNNSSLPTTSYAPPPICLATPNVNFSLTAKLALYFTLNWTFTLLSMFWGVIDKIYPLEAAS